MRRLRIAVWGLGRHAIGKILPAIASADDLDLYGVCSRNKGSVGFCVDRWKCAGWTVPAQMLLDPRVDVVYVATPIGLHHDHGGQVLDAGKHLWCEKPLTSRLQDTLELLDSAHRKGLSVCEGHMYLHHPQFRKLSRDLGNGRIGALLSVEIRFGIPRLEQPGFRTDPVLGGGALLDVGSYPISAIDALFPEESAVVRYADINTPIGSRVDTGGHAIIVLSNDVVGYLEWRINCAYRNEIDVWGAEGSIYSDRIFSKPDDHVPMFRLRDARGLETTEYGEPGNHFLSMLQHFCHVAGDSRACEAERTRIARRAEILHQIWTTRQINK